MVWRSFGERSATDLPMPIGFGKCAAFPEPGNGRSVVLFWPCGQKSLFICQGGMKVISEEKRIWAEGLLRKKSEELGRLPKKEDFDEITRSRIKAILGPWPRALEAAGLKAAKSEKKPKKRRRSGRARKKQESEQKEDLQ